MNRSKQSSYFQRLIGVFITLVLGFGFWSNGAEAADELFKLKGKVYKTNDLPVSGQQKLFEMESEIFGQRKAMLEELLLEQYFADLAKGGKKSSLELQEEALKVPEPSEKELQSFFEENKARIPPNMQFDQIKDQLKQFVKQQKVTEKRNDVLNKLLADKNNALMLTKPKGPSVEIAWQGYPSKGAENAKITIVEFADYRCPHCKLASDSLKAIWPKYKDKVRLVFMDFPAKGGVSRTIAMGGYCAHKQNKFWEYNEQAFAKQADLAEGSPLDLAKTLKLDTKAFETCMAAPDAGKAVDQAMKEGERIGVSGTPSFFVNGEKLIVTGKFEDALSQTIDAALLTN